MNLSHFRIWLVKLRPRIGGGADKIPPVDVIHVAVAVVVNAVAWHLVGIAPDIAREIGMIDIHARIHHRHHDFGGSGRIRPCRLRPDALQIVLLVKVGVVGRDEFPRAASSHHRIRNRRLKAGHVYRALAFFFSAHGNRASMDNN